MRKLIFLLVAVMIATVQLWAQQRTITGKVTDDKGAPIPNASVVVKGTNTGTVTKNDGTYSITVPPTARVLVISSVDYETQEINISSQSTINAALKTAEKTMTEVVVTAFGIRKDKKAIGYGVTQLNTAQLTQAHTTNITTALEGKIPGVRISGLGGDFSGASIIIRGFNTFTGSNQPLFVVDGIAIDNGGGGNALQTGPVNSNRAIDINQDDIESITVLKGPSASALYGARATNGVILITTKKGKMGEKNSIQFSTSYQIEQVNRYPDFQNEYAQGVTDFTSGSPTYLQGIFNGTVNSSWGPKITGQTVNQYNPATNAFDRAAPLQAYPDNLKDLFENGYNWQTSVGFSGGNDRTAFRFSYGYLRNAGVLENNLLQRHSFSVNSSSKVNNRLTVTISGVYTNNFSKRTQQGNQLSNPLFRSWFQPRSYDLTGLAWEDAVGNQRYPMGEDNPYWTIKHNRFNDEINRFFGNVGLNLKILSWLQADAKIGSDLFSNFRHGYDQVGARGQANTNAGGAGAVTETRNNFRNLSSNIYFTATRKFSDFNVTLIAGNEISQSYTRNLTTTGRGIIIRDFENIANTTTIATPGVSSTKTRLIGVYGDATILYKSIATLEGTLRNDWSSTFKPGNWSYLFPSLTGSINLTELFPSIKNKVIENIKIRGSIAKVGKAGDFAYSTDSYYGSITHADGFGPQIQYPFNGLQAFSLSNSAGNAALGPEFTTNNEVGAEIALFKNRLNIDATIYKQKSTDLIFQVPVPATSGITSVVKNAGDMHTSGVELGINGSPVKNKLITWDINVSFTKFKSIVDKLETGVTNIFLGGFTTPNVRLVAGEEYGQIYGNAFQRDTKTGKIIVNDATTTSNQLLWGLPMITSGVQRIGNPNPKWLLDVTNTVSIKGFTLSFLVDYKKGGDLYSRNVADIQRNGAGIETAMFPRFDANGIATKPYLFDAVYPNGTANTTYVTPEQYWGNNGKFVAAEGFIFETTWLRIREASISYHLPSTILQKTPFGGAEVSVFGRNLYLRAPNYPHLDPEQNVLGVSSAQGLEFNALPQTRTMGVSIRFNL
jgi:TonB-linked SusC/RagA family outer membrane protein